MRKKLSQVFLVLSIVTACFSGYKLYEAYSQYQEAAQIIQEVQQHITVVSPDEGTMEEDPIQPQPEIIVGVDFASLKLINEDIFAWIEVPNTNISYPILQSYNNEYYLYRLMNRKWNNSGSIYLDYRNSQDFTDKHSIIYGHHMKNGTMFAALMGYKEQNFYEEHPSFQIITPEKEFTVQVFSAYNVMPTEDSWQREFASEAEFEAWLKDTVEDSLFIPSSTPSVEDRIITLSTCDYNYDDERFIVVGYIIDEKTLS
ncbi:MAG: class B sortase [Erysipelotrichales bacterium]|nr:class B sortase [Erysipelotrichales bacterium]